MHLHHRLHLRFVRRPGDILIRRFLFVATSCLSSLAAASPARPVSTPHPSADPIRNLLRLDQACSATRAVVGDTVTVWTNVGGEARSSRTLRGLRVQLLRGASSVRWGRSINGTVFPVAFSGTRGGIGALLTIDYPGKVVVRTCAEWTDGSLSHCTEPQAIRVQTRAAFDRETREPARGRPRILLVADWESWAMEEREARLLTDIFQCELQRADGGRVIDRDAAVRVASEFMLSQAGCTSQECVVTLGRMLGAELAVLGSIRRSGDRYDINVGAFSVSGERVSALERRVDAISRESMVRGASGARVQASGVRSSELEKALGNLATDLAGRLR